MQHLRIIRTLAPESLELAQTMVRISPPVDSSRLTFSLPAIQAVENLWPNKVEYSISIPQKAVVFGTYIPINITLIPMLKGLTIGNVICALKEVHTLSCRQKASVKQDTRHISTQTFTTGRFEESTNGDLGCWRLSDRVPLPKTLNACVQDCEVPSIKIRHKCLPPYPPYLWFGTDDRPIAGSSFPSNCTTLTVTCRNCALPSQ